MRVKLHRGGGIIDCSARSDMVDGNDNLSDTKQIFNAIVKAISSRKKRQ